MGDEKTVFDPESISLLSKADAEATAAYLRDNQKDETILRYFAFDHLPVERLRAVSGWFAVVATLMHATLPRCAERTAGLRRLLESKDCAVRAAMP